MIVGINYNQDGSRYIARIRYDAEQTREEKQELAHFLTYSYDEVYIISDFNFKNNDQDFIDEIVTKGCRMV